MDTAIEFNEMVEHLEGLLLDIYRWYLEIDDLSQMRFDYSILLEESDGPDEFDELYELPHPEFFTCNLRFENAIFNKLCIGNIRFGRYKGQKVIIEQDASPLLVYWKSG